MEKTEILGVPVNVTTTNEIIQNIKNSINDKKKYSIIAINLNKIIAFHERKQFDSVIKSFDCFIPDGISVVKACNELKDRITGVDLFQEICKRHQEIGAKIFLYGSKQEVIEKTKEKLEQEYENIKIVGMENGFTQDNEQLLSKINASGANILFVAMGSPKQEDWIYNNKGKLDVNVFMGVGGTFDVVSGKLKRAPFIFRNFGLEWLYRMIKEPVKRTKKIPLQFKYWCLIKKEKRKKEKELWKK